MIYRSTEHQIEDYYNSGRVNQSALKEILNNGMQAYLDKEEELKFEPEKKHLIIGSAVDCSITMGEEYFKNKYHITNLAKKPGEKGMAIIKMLYEKVANTTKIDEIMKLGEYGELIQGYCDEIGFYPKRAKADYREDSRVGTIANDIANQNYWLDLVNSAGKQVLSEQESVTTTAIISSLTTHPHTARIFEDSNDVDIVYQFPIYFEVDGVLCKCLLDMVRVVHSSKRIMPIDFKTLMEYTLNFPRSVRTWRYDVQGSFYSTGLIHGAGELSKLIGKDLDGYTISNFAFIAESTKKPGTPFIFPLSDSIMRCGELGDGRYLRGWRQALNIYSTWAKNEFIAEKVFEETGGVLFINEGFECSHII